MNIITKTTALICAVVFTTAMESRAHDAKYIIHVHRDTVINGCSVPAGTVIRVSGEQISSDVMGSACIAIPAGSVIHSNLLKMPNGNTFELSSD
jgi:hypothetical protein